MKGRTAVQAAVGSNQREVSSREPPLGETQHRFRDEKNLTHPGGGSAEHVHHLGRLETWALR